MQVQERLTPNIEKMAADYAIVITESGTDTYVGEASVGTLLAAAKWKAYKITSTGRITYADGNAEFDNVATDLTALSYS